MGGNVELLFQKAVAAVMAGLGRDRNRENWVARFGPPEIDVRGNP